MKKKKPIALLFLLASVLCILFAFCNSLQNGRDSLSRSTTILLWLQSHFHNFEFLNNLILRKLAHIFEYTILGFFLANFWHCMNGSKKSRWNRFFLTALPIPLIDELIQLATDGRSSRFSDVLIDCFGLVLGLTLASGILRSIHRHHASQPLEKVEKHYCFFRNDQCEYFPCHPTEHPEDFNCLFCYCPLYALGDQCGGAFSYNAKGYKDCTKCSFPHHRENYSKIIARYSEIAEIARKHQD